MASDRAAQGTRADPSAEPGGRRRLSHARTWLVRLLRFLIILTLILLFGLAGGTLWLRGAMRAQLPQLDGEQHIRAVLAPVTVERDGHGVPHLQAASVDDLMAAQGYVTASDRLWQMDMIRRMAAGEAAEVLGPKLVEHDRMQRVLAFRPAAEHVVASLSPRDRQYFEAYARGVNAYVEEARGHLPAEFRLLHYTPRPWQPVDSALVGLSMIQMLDTEWPVKLAREAIEARLGPALASDLYPTGSWRDHPPTQSMPDLTQPPVTPPEAPRGPAEMEEWRQSDGLQSSLEELRALKQLSGAACAGCLPGSNEWAVAGIHTASGRPLLANDMHLEHDVPNIWYQLDLRAGAFHVAGVSVPGLPFIAAGHNEHIAWGFTAMYGDTQDVYVEKTDGRGQYWANNAWHEPERVQETIRVRWGRDQTIEALRTEHGPVLTPLLPHERRMLTLRWTMYDAAPGGVALFDLNNAANWNDFRTALSHWSAPTLNVVYADDAGHIGYQAAGFIPLRPAGLQGTPIADLDHEWQDNVPFAAMPTVLDPPNGLLATANSRITPDNFATPLTLSWAAPYRNERIWKWLAGKDKLTRGDMLTLQTDTYSEVDEELAQRFAYAIDHASHASARLRSAADLLRSWDGVVSVNSPAAAITFAAKVAFWPLVLEPRLGAAAEMYDWPESSFAQEQLITHGPAAWLPSGYSSWDDLLAAAVEKGLAGARAPHDLKSWQYGSFHTVDLEHPLYNRLLFFHWTGTGEQPQSGDTTTVKQVGHTFGPSQRFTMDWSDVDGSTENIVLGESGDPLSPYYRDQWTEWYDGTTSPMPFSRAAVTTAARHTLQLLP